MLDFVQRLKQKMKKSQENPTIRFVDFIICGIQKGGTSALDKYLRDHPEICMANKKELHYFDREDNFRKGLPVYADYHSSFFPLKSHKLFGENTPVYMYWQNAPKRIWEYKPEMKLIILLRNPIARAYSHWNMQRIKSKEQLSFLDAIHKEQERCIDPLSPQNRLFSYIRRGFYVEQLQRLWKYFPLEQTLILKSEDLKNYPSKILGEVYDFLGVNQLEAIKNKSVHTLPYESEMSSEERRFLINIFEDEIHNLERILDWNCSEWLSK